MIAALTTTGNGSSLSSRPVPALPLTAAGTAEKREGWLSKNRIISWAHTKVQMLRYTPATRLPDGPTEYALRRISDGPAWISKFGTAVGRPLLHLRPLLYRHASVLHSQVGKNIILMSTKHSEPAIKQQTRVVLTIWIR